MITTSLKGRDWRGRAICLSIEEGVVTQIRPVAATGRLNVSILPGLWDHHVHFRSAAAARHSVDLKEAESRKNVLARLRYAAGHSDGQIRAIGWDETVTGDLTRADLDQLSGPDVPIRVQHRSGHLWVLNSAAVQAIARSGQKAPRDGRIWNDDKRLRAVGSSPIDVAHAAQLLRARGVIGATDMTSTATTGDIHELHTAIDEILDLKVFGSAEALGSDGVKIVLQEHRLPDPDELVDWIRLARPRSVAIHATTAEALALTIAALAHSFIPGDRIEHAFTTPLNVPAQLGAFVGDPRMVRVGAHPGFLLTHGDRHVRWGGQQDLADYQRLRSWRESGATLLGGTDSPFGPADPWKAMQAAVERLTKKGEVLGPEEALTPEEAFGLFTLDGLRPDTHPLDISPGQGAYLCIIRGQWNDLRHTLGEARVLATVRPGDISGRIPPPNLKGY